VPVIALTANVTKNDVEKCLLAGMNDYLPKPFTPEDLYRKLFDDLKLIPGKPAKQVHVIKDQRESFDLSYLRQVSGNNEVFVKEMVETFIQSIPQSLSEIEEAVRISDTQKLARTLHQIKPSLSLLGLDILKESSIRLEERIKVMKLPSSAFETDIGEFIGTCRNAIRLLTNELAYL
jgi:hypothetical protein